jgi:methyl-accepting chemotaxis protein
MFRNLKLKTKMLIVGSVLTVLPLIVFGLFVFNQNAKTVAVATDESIKLATTDLDHIAEGVYRMVETQNDVLLKAVRSYLSVARDTVSNLGGISFAREKISWTAVNQYNKAMTQIQLPKMLVGNTWFGKANDLNSEVPVVDHVQKLAAGVTCTVFQRMNAAGDMLRIATNVIKTDGTRAIGTYIPKTNPNGSENPVISTVLRGQTFNGRAFVVNKWYLTAYEPIYGADNSIVGALYVGIPQESAQGLRQAIMDIKIGSTGYLWVLNSKGHYVISKDGKRDGEDISAAKDADGNLFIQDMVNKARVLKPGEFAEHYYPWKNAGDQKARTKFARIMYFEPWDWVIGAGSYEDEFLSGAAAIEKMADKSFMVLMGVIAVSLVSSVLIWLVVSAGIAKPIVNIVNAINKVAETRDLTIEVPTAGRDEIGIMARQFNRMLELLRNSFVMVSQAASNVDNHARDVFLRATANQKRAQEQEEKMKQMRDIVAQMKATAGEVAAASNDQREAASSSSKTLAELVSEMQSVSESSSSQVEEAGSANERVEAMGETGSKVVQTAQHQGQQVKAVTQAVANMNGSMTALNDATSKAMDFANSTLLAVDEGKNSVEATVDGMRAISESSDQISEIITVITEIAEQTNLLSLNAAIEAARAGSHGKGFAVVADEVGKLAQRSSEAAKEITQLIKDSVERVAEGAKLSDKSKMALEKIAQGGGTNLKAIGDISTAAEILSEGTRNVDEMMKTLNQMAEEIAKMAGQQGQRRSAAQDALNALTEKANTIFASIDNANKEVAEIGARMSDVVSQSDKMKSMTSAQAERSRTLTEITTLSAEASVQTLQGAGEVVGITEELQHLSKAMSEQINQFKVATSSDGVGASAIPDNPS